MLAAQAANCVILLALNLFTARQLLQAIIYPGNKKPGVRTCLCGRPVFLFYAFG